MTVIVEVDPLTDDRWNRFVRSHTDSDVFHSTRWLKVLSDTYGFSLGARLAVEGDDLVAGAVFADVAAFGRIGRKCLAFSDFCDPLVTDPEAWFPLVESALEGDCVLTMRCRTSRRPADDERFRQAGRVAWHRCDISRSTEEIWGSLHPSARRAIRKADKAGVEVRPAESLAELRKFYLLHLEVRASKYGLLAQPYAFFENIWREFLEPGLGELLLAWFDGHVVGGTLYLDWGDTAYYKFNASDAGNLSVRPNDLLLWSGIEGARKRGLTWLDFGVSDLDQPGLIRFKEKYATESGEVITFLAGPETRSDDDEIELRNLIQDVSSLTASDGVPRSITERAGELLYRYFA